MPHFQVNGLNFHYNLIQGEGPTLMLLCSTGLDYRQWKKLPSLLPDRKMICLTYLGYEPSESWNEDYSVENDYYAAEFLLNQEIGEIDIFGHSYGGFIALKLAVNNPHKIRKIALHEPTAWGCLKFTDKDELKDEFGEVVETFFTEGLPPEEFLQDFVDYWNEPGHWKSMNRERKNHWRSIQSKILAEVRHLCYDDTPPEFYRGISQPVLMSLSKDTPKHHYEVCSILSKNIPNINVIHVPGGHMGIITHPESVLFPFSEWIKY